MIVQSTLCIASHSYWIALLLQSGAVFHLGLFLFNYDYTLDESGVEAAEETNQQQIVNQLGCCALIALGRLGGLLSEGEGLLSGGRGC